MFKQDLDFNPPYLNAAGFGGYMPDSNLFSPEGYFGGFVTNPISFQARQPAKGKRYLPYVGGYLLHTGLSNPGFFLVIKKYASKWQRASVQIIVHLIAESSETMQIMVQRLEEIESVSGIEMGLRHDHTLDEIKEFLQAAQGELPIIARLSRMNCLEFAKPVIEAGAFAISLAPPRGKLIQTDQAVSGRLYGPAVWPEQMQISDELLNMGINLIAAGGIDTIAKAQWLIDQGALAVQLDTISFANMAAFFTKEQILEEEG